MSNRILPGRLEAEFLALLEKRPKTEGIIYSKRQAFRDMIAPRAKRLAYLLAYTYEGDARETMLLTAELTLIKIVSEEP